MSIRAPKMLGFPVPVIADPVAGPTVTYGEELTSIKFLTRDGGWAGVTFEHLDSIRVSRGEFDPYPSDWKPGDQLHWVSEVVPSPPERRLHTCSSCPSWKGTLISETTHPVYATFDGVASLKTVRAHVKRWMQEVRERRKQMGKT